MKKQQKKLNSTFRLPYKADMGADDVFCAEQYEALRKLFPGMSVNILVQTALRELARVAPQWVLEDKQEEMRQLQEIIDGISSVTESSDE